MASPSKDVISRPTRNGSRVGPAPRSCDDMVEIRPRRKIRIRHLNPKKRDEKFAKEMEVYLQARHNGLVDGVFIPPRLSQGRKVSKTVNEATKSTVSLNYKKEDTIENDKGNIEEEDKENINSQRTAKPQSSRSMVSSKTQSSSKHFDSEDSDSDSDTVKNYKGQETTYRDSEATGWVSKAMTRQQAEIHSPSRGSVAPSEGIQSASGILVSMSRPTSEVKPGTLPVVSETQNNKHVESIELTDGPTESPRADSVKSARTPRKTKGHRPISAKNIRGAKSMASSEVGDDLIADLSDFETAVRHKESSFKDVTLFFIHGVGGSADVWNFQLDFFTSLGLEVIAPDLLGHGFSSCPDRAKDYFFNEILADLEAVFDKYCKRQNIIIAHSYG